MHPSIDVSDILGIGFYLLVVTPVLALIFAFAGPPGLRKAARIVLVAEILAYVALAILCLVNSHAPPPQAGFNALILVWIVPAFIAWALLEFWRASRRREYVQSLPPAQRRVEELVDINRALEAARDGLADLEREAASWLPGSKDPKQLEWDISMQKMIISRLEAERAKRT